MSLTGGPVGTQPVPSGPFVHREDLRADARGRVAHVAWTSAEAGSLAFHILGAEQEQARADVVAARHRVEDAMGVPRGSVFYLEQAHSADVVTAGPGWEEACAPIADASVSPDGHMPLAVMVADCLPVVFVDGLTGATAVAHAGRRGLLDGVLENTVDALLALRPEGSAGAFGLKAWIGPGISGESYEVPQSMQDEAVARIPELEATTSWGTPALALASGAQAVLRARGVAVERIALDTFTDERVFSHRRAPGRGRFAGLVWTTPADVDQDHDAGDARG